MARRKGDRRARPTPRWLTGRTDLDQVAQRRCLMILSVLSGEKPVTTAVEELGISRGHYYQLETKALVAMLRAVAPGAEAAGSPDDASMAKRIAELEAKLSKLEQDKRRAERLLYLTRQVLPPGPVKTAAGRPPSATKARAASTTSGSLASRLSRARKTQSATSAPSSIPTTAGEGES
jgi:hypothetical protein